jgi:sterol 14alpha-demethylase
MFVGAGRPTLYVMTTKTPLPPVVSGPRPILGHTAEFMTSHEALFERGLAEHGTIFSLRLPGKPAIVLIGKQHSDFLFGETDKRLSIRTAYPFFRHMFAPDNYFLAEYPEYQRQREIMLPRFSGRQLEGYLRVMDSRAIALCDALGDQGEFDVLETFGQLILRITADCFLGESVSARLDGQLTEGLFRAFAEGQDPIVPGWAPVPHMRRSHKARDVIRTIVRDLLEERRRKPVDPPDFLQGLTDATYADGEPMPDHVRVNLIMTLLHAGRETTTGHLSWAVVDLLRHPGELAKVLAEQEAELTNPGHFLELTEVHRLAALDRALHESERLHPITNGMVRRATESFEYAGYRIPKGAIVLTDPRLSHRRPEVFPDPSRYQPDRFIGNKAARQALIGFGGGVHRCLGQRFAYLEMHVILTRLLQRFDLELIDVDVQPVPGQKVKWPQHPCRVRYAKRQGAC